MKHRIFIADDHRIVRDGLRALIEKETDLVLAGMADDGRQALKMVRKLEPDVVIMDIAMPGRDGQQTLDDIRKVEELHGVSGLEACTVIMITALDDSENIMRAFHQGKCEAYLTKPLDREKLFSLLRELGLVGEQKI